MDVYMSLNYDGAINYLSTEGDKNLIFIDFVSHTGDV